MTIYQPVDLFPDAEAVASTALRAAGITRVYSMIPKNPTYPLVIVRRVGGVPTTRHRLDTADLQFDAYGETKSAARLLAAQVRQAMMEAEATSVTVRTGNAYVTAVEDVMGMTWLTDPANLPISRYTFTMRVFLHAA